MAMYLTEDSLINWQTDYNSKFPPKDNPNYVHMHVLRTALSTTDLNDVINTSPIAVNQTFSFSWSTSLATKVKEKQCHVLMVVYNAETEEIVQVSEAKLMQQ